LPDNYILSVGTIETRKNLNGVLQAIPLMKNDLPIVVIGRKTKYYNFLKVQMEKQKIDPNRFIFLKNVSIEELPSIYQMATVFVYPSFFEGFGIPIIEALHSNTPVITSKGGCFPEAAGPSSLFVDPSNIEEIADAIDSLCADEGKRNLMKIKGKEFVQKFEPNILTQQLVDVYKKLM
jgi:glycosyltransferase involved in cell wall biosynthesis